jgi:hypothetical protein
MWPATTNLTVSITSGMPEYLKRIWTDRKDLPATGKVVKGFVQ